MTKDEKDEVDKLLEFLFSPDKEIVELYARILFNKYDYDTIEECAFNHKPVSIIFQKLRDAYYMYTNTNIKGYFEIVYNPIKKSIIVK